MTEQELDLVNNVAKKLEIYMQRNNRTMFGLSKLMNIDRQPFYRILSRKYVPTISSLFIIASNLNCTVHELISEKIFIDIPVYDDLSLDNKHATFRIYISNQDYETVGALDVYGVNHNNKIRIYYNVLDFVNDGIYIANLNDSRVEIEILSAGSELVIAKIKNEEHRLNRGQIEPIAKYFKEVPIVEDDFCKRQIGNQ
jgi:transcriptional regulator with XRE-family HTH domain